MAKMLVVDDEEALRKILLRVFSGLGHAVTTAADGKTGERLALEEKPDMVLLDIDMPGKDGVEVLQTLRQELPLTGIIMISGNTDECRAKACLEMGACDYLPKPLDLEELTAIVTAWLAKQDAEAA